MAKGDDAVARKKNRAQRKKGRSMKTKDSVSSRVASIIAAKRRRKTGKRRVCEAMCFTLPTPEDPFNDRNDPVAKKEKLLKTESSRGKKETAALEHALPREKRDFPVPSIPSSETNGKAKGVAHADSDDRVSKYLILCLKAIQEAASLDRRTEETSDTNQGSALLACKWGIEFWRSLSSGLDVVDSTVDCASPEQIAWLVSVASDIIARREKEGLLVPSPFLVFLVPSHDRASEARLLCKPLKALGVHTVSLHPGASLDHQVQGLVHMLQLLSNMACSIHNLLNIRRIFQWKNRRLTSKHPSSRSLKSCEPEFIVSTPDRFLALVSMGALDISSVSLLVLDGLRSLMASGFGDDIKSIRERISGDPRTVIFGDDRRERSSGPLLLDLIKQPAHIVSLF